MKRFRELYRLATMRRLWDSSRGPERVRVVLPEEPANGDTFTNRTGVPRLRTDGFEVNMEMPGGLNTEFVQREALIRP